MGIQLTIDSDDAYRMASRLAELTGESLTEAVTVAIRERLEREAKVPAREAKLKRIREITADIRDHIRAPLPTSNHDWLYDENGLPR